MHEKAANRKQSMAKMHSIVDLTCFTGEMTWTHYMNLILPLESYP